MLSGHKEALVIIIEQYQRVTRGEPATELPWSNM